MSSSPEERLAEAIMCGEARRVRALIKNYSIDMNEPLSYDEDDYGLPPILLAAREHQYEIVKRLIVAGANVDEVDDDGCSALHYAARDGSVTLIKLLNHHHAEINATDNDDDSPLVYALRDCNDMKKMKCAKKLIAFGASLDDFNAQVELVRNGPDYIQLLIDAGFNVSELHDEDDGTPLHWVTGYRRGFRAGAATLAMLVNVCGIDVNALDFHDRTACHNTASSGDFQTLRWLIEKGADVDLAADSGTTPLHETAGAGGGRFKSKCMCLLLAAGANVHAVVESGTTALHCAARLEDHEEAVHLLLAAGADLDATDDRGVTPRHELRRRGHKFMVDPAKLRAARRVIATTQLDLVRERAFQVCIGLQSLRLDALQMCEILSHACGPMASMVEFHQWWAIATTCRLNEE